MPLHRLMRKFLPGRKLDEIHDIEGWRIYYVRLMMLISLFALPIGLLFSIQTYLAQHLYGMIYFHISIIALMAAILWLGDRIPQVNAFFIVVYGITLTILVVLGPYYARPAWLVMCVITAAFLFGRNAAILMVFFNAGVLAVLYLAAPARFTAWEVVHQEPFSRWLMFCCNLTMLSLVSNITGNIPDQSHEPSYCERKEAEPEADNGKRRAAVDQ